MSSVYLNPSIKLQYIASEKTICVYVLRLEKNKVTPFYFYPQDVFMKQETLFDKIRPEIIKGNSFKEKVGDWTLELHHRHKTPKIELLEPDGRGQFLRGNSIAFTTEEYLDLINKWFSLKEIIRTHG